MNMFARFDENPAMTLQDIKTDGRTDGRTHTRTDGQTDGQRENSIPTTNKVCGGNKYIFLIQASEKIYLFEAYCLTGISEQNKR